jgi:uncharacterized membrane protein YhiD involved in acid resistance
MENLNHLQDLSVECEDNIEMDVTRIGYRVVGLIGFIWLRK